VNRSGYTDDCDGWALIRWRGAVASSIKGKRGQAMLKDLLTALDAMPSKRLIRSELVEHGELCAIGVLGAARGLPMADFDPEDNDLLATTFDVARPLIQEIEFVNDESGSTPERRWTMVRQWVASKCQS